ncbi:MAG: hypothetical protein K2H28_10555 [Ruminococcus sp.]|nr:hypothetical protein [Ruminococcus sp.]
MFDLNSFLATPTVMRNAIRQIPCEMLRPYHNHRFALYTGERLDNIVVSIKEGLSEQEAEIYVIESNLIQRGFDNLKISKLASVIAIRHSKMFSQGKRNDIICELQMLENPTSRPVG